MSTLEQPQNDPGFDGSPRGGAVEAERAAAVEQPGESTQPDRPEHAEPPEQGEPSGDATDEAPERSTLERPAADDPFDAAEIQVDPGRVRHAPRFGRFALLGGLLGLVLGFVLAPFARYENLNVSWHFDPWGLALVLAAMLVPIGILLGCVVALVADRRSRRKATG